MQAQPQHQQVHVDYAGWMWKSAPQSHDADKKDTLSRKLSKAMNSFRLHFIPQQRFKKRYFVLDTNTLYYFRDDSLTYLSGSIDLSMVLRVQPFDGARGLWPGAPPFAIQVVTDARVFILVPETLDAQNEWLRRLGAIVRAGKRQGLVAKSLRGKVWEEHVSSKKQYQQARRNTLAGARRNTVMSAATAAITDPKLGHTTSDAFNSTESDFADEAPSHESNRFTIDGFPCLRGMEDASVEHSNEPFATKSRSDSLIFAPLTNEVFNDDEESWEVLTGNVGITKVSMCSEKRLGHLPIFEELKKSGCSTAEQHGDNENRLRSLALTVYKYGLFDDFPLLYAEIKDMGAYQQALWAVLVKQTDMLLYNKEKSKRQVPKGDLPSDYNMYKEGWDRINRLLHSGKLEQLPCGSLVKPASGLNEVSVVPETLSSPCAPVDHLNILLYGRVRVSVVCVCLENNEMPTKPEASASANAREDSYRKNRSVSRASPEDHERAAAASSIVIQSTDGSSVRNGDIYLYNKPADAGKQESTLGCCYWLEITANSGPVVLSHERLSKELHLDLGNKHIFRTYPNLEHLVEIVTVEPSYILSISSSEVYNVIPTDKIRYLCLPYSPQWILSCVPSLLAAYSLMDDNGLPVHDGNGEIATLLCFTGKFVKLGPGDILFQAGDWGDCCYVVIDGTLGISSLDSSTGEHQLLGLKSAGSCVGESSLSRPSIRCYNATALSPVYLWRISHSTLSALFSQKPSLWRKINNCAMWREPSHLVRLPVMHSLCSGEGEAARLGPLIEFFRPVVLSKGPNTSLYQESQETKRSYRFSRKQELVLVAGNQVEHHEDCSIEHVSLDSYFFITHNCVPWLCSSFLNAG